MQGLTLPDADDCLVLASGARIVTMNLRDFPASATEPHGIAAVHPDDFLCGLVDADPELVQASAEAVHANLSRTAPSLRDYLDRLERQGLPQLRARLRA